MDKRGTCFLITPIGQPNSAVRGRADQIGAFLTPLAAARGLQLVRGDAIGLQGDVLVQVIREIVDARVVVADLTGLNPNVLYELGLADAFQKPVLRLTDDPANLSFNFRGARVWTVRSSAAGELIEDDAVTVRAQVGQFFDDVLAWNYRVIDSVSMAMNAMPAGLDDSRLTTMLGGFLLADGWGGVEQVLKAAGGDVKTFRERKPREDFPQFKVHLAASLLGETADLRLSFGDWTDEEVREYARTLIDVLVECGSPYRVVISHGGRTYVAAEPGERLTSERQA